MKLDLDELEEKMLEALPKLLAVARAAKAWGDTTGCPSHGNTMREVGSCAACLAEETIEDVLLDAVAELDAL